MAEVRLIDVDKAAAALADLPRCVWRDRLKAGDFDALAPPADAHCCGAVRRMLASRVALFAAVAHGSPELIGAREAEHAAAMEALESLHADPAPPPAVEPAVDPDQEPPDISPLGAIHLLEDAAAISKGGKDVSTLIGWAAGVLRPIVMPPGLDDVIELPQTPAATTIPAAIPASVAPFLRAYIRETKRPDCLPEYRFEVTLPRGRTAWRSNLIDAVAAILDAVNGEQSQETA